MYKRQLNIAGFRGACHYISNIGAIKTAITSQVFLRTGINNTNVDKKRTAVIPQGLATLVQTDFHIELKC
jgi:hypothetical protein